MKLYPSDIVENQRRRAEIFSLSHKSLETAKTVKALCEKDILFFFNVFLWAEDPHAEKGVRHGIPKNRIRPIVTYPFQDDFILDLQKAIDSGEDLISDKSRDMLATYMVLGVYLHGWLYKGHKYMISSWKEDEIDGKEDTSTHFGKLRFFLNRLPLYLMPTGWNWKKNSSSMKLQNPENGGTLTGSAASANIGSGRREDSIFFDELSKWETGAQKSWISASDATKSKIGVWTPRGSGNFAAELMRGGEVKNKKHLLWNLHPEKTFTSEDHVLKVKAGEVFDKVRGYTVQLHTDQLKTQVGCYIDQYGRLRSEWYDSECRTRTAEDIAENLDCDYLATGRPIFDTLKCNTRLYESKPAPFVGDLMWKVRPIFNEGTGFVRNQAQLEVEFVENVNGLWHVWEKPEKGYRDGYIIGADTAEGLEQHDWDVAKVLKRWGDKPKYVARLRAHIKMHEYAEELAKIGIYYNRSFVNVERNNHGHGVLAHLIKWYDRLFHKAVFTKGFAEITDKIGHDTTGQSKPVVIGTLGKAISHEEFLDPDEVFWRETITFVDSDGRMEAQGKSKGEKCYDDEVMASGITWWTHLNMPLPAFVREEVKLDGWRKRQNMQRKQSSMVGFAV